MEVKHVIETVENNIERKTVKLFEKEVKQITKRKSGKNIEKESKNVPENEGRKIAGKVPQKIMETKVANILELEDKKTIRTTMSKILNLEADETSETPAAKISQMKVCNTSKREVYRISETSECDLCKVKFTERSYQEDDLPAEFPPYESTCEKCLNRNTIFDNLDKQPTHTVAKLYFSGNKQISLEENLDIIRKIKSFKVSKACINRDVSVINRTTSDIDINTKTSDIEINQSTSGIDTNTSAYININPSTCGSDSTSVYDDDINLNACDVDIERTTYDAYTNQSTYDTDINPDACNIDNQSTYDTDINPDAYNIDNQSTYDTDIRSSTSYTNINSSASNIVTEPHMFGICTTADGSKDTLQSCKNLTQNERTCSDCYGCFKSVTDLLSHNCEKISNSKSLFEVQKESHSNEESYRRSTSEANSSEEIGNSRQTHFSEHLHAHICVKCNKYFNRESSLRDHILNCDKESFKTSRKLYSAQEPYRCVDCFKFYKNEESLQKHLETCRKHFMANYEELLENGGALQPFICQACNKEFNSRRSLEYHRNICKRLYSLQSAIQSQNSIKPFICEVCTKRYKTESSLKEHKSKSCKKKFITKPPLKLEQQVITENESHKFEVFKNGYSKEWVLSHPQHSDVNALYHFPKTKAADGSKKHEEDSRERKPFKCTYPYCKKCFKTESARRQHSLSHSSIWKCQNCFLSFDKSQDYDAHMSRCSQKWSKTPPGTYNKTYFPDN